LGNDERFAAQIAGILCTFFLFAVVDMNIGRKSFRRGENGLVHLEMLKKHYKEEGL
jgi:hypothetical protein